MIQSASNPTANMLRSRRINVGAQQVATTYAKAFLGAVAAAKGGPAAMEAAVGELDSFVVDVFDTLPKLETALTSGLISQDDKIELLDKLLKGQASPLLLSFLKVLAKHGRLDVLRSVHWAVHKLYDQDRQISRVDVASAVPLDEQTQARLTESIQRMIGGAAALTARVRPDLIGGLVLRVGDTVYDGSIATRLNKFRQQMIDRSVHEIQSRRDSFSSPE